MRWYCSYCDRNYLAKLLALVSSLKSNESRPFTLIVVCLDELTRILLNRLHQDCVITVPLHELEQGDHQLLACRANRNQMEYFWTLTPTIILRLLEWRHSIDQLTYVDADLYFFNNPDHLFAEHPQASVLIHEHRFAQKYQVLERYGRFNVGLMVFRRSKTAFDILRWWRERCIEWCHDRLVDGKFGDQLYLEQWPAIFQGVGILTHPGVGVAPWNQNDQQFDSGNDGKPQVHGQPVIFYHFHSLDCITASLYRPAKLLHYWFELPVLTLCYLPYVSALQSAFAAIQNLLPTFTCGMGQQGVPLSHTFLADRATAEVLDHHMTGMTRINLGNDWVCCRLPIEPPDPVKLAELLNTPKGL